MNDSKIINNIENLKKLREEKHLTQLQLSIELEVAQETISKYELGVAFPQPSMLIKLANYFNCSVDYLLGITDVTTPVKKLSENIDNVKSAELYNKYQTLSKDDRYTFDRFLNFLLTNKK